MDIFDTSAVRGVSGPTFEKVAATRDITVSPLTVYELLCHLDEKEDDDCKDPQQVFLRRKGQMLKLRHFRILDDPYALYALSIESANLVNPSRFEDAQLLPVLLERLEATGTLEEFYAQEITDQERRKRLVRECAQRARKTLDDLEQKFKGVMDDIKSKLNVKMGAKDESEKKFTDDDLLEIIAAQCMLLREGHREDGAVVTDDNRFTKLTINGIYAHYGYMVARAMEYAADPAMNYQVNDVEDGVICLHLNLGNRDMLVTGDKGTFRCLTRALNKFNMGNDPASGARCRVFKPAAYLEEIGAH